MTPQVLTVGGKPSYASFWPSIAAASAQLAQRRVPRAGRVPSRNPAVPERLSPGFVAGRAPERTAQQEREIG